MNSRALVWILSIVVFVKGVSSQAEAQEYVVADRVLVLPDAGLPAADANVRVLAVVGDARELVRDIHLADWPLAEDDCQFGDCDEATRPERCGGRCLRGAPSLLSLDRTLRRAILVAETSDLRATRPLVLFGVNLGNGEVRRLGRVEASFLTDQTVSPDGRFVAFTERSRGGPDWELGYVDLQSETIGSDAVLFYGRINLATEYRRVTALSWLTDGTLGIDAEIGLRDRATDIHAGVGPVIRRLRIVFDPRSSQVVSAMALH